MDTQQARDAVLDFWFLPPSDPAHGTTRTVWFKKDAAFDATIGERFGDLVEHAVAGGLKDWDASGPRGVLARILVLDQFTRNTGRDTPAAFAGDALALAAARELVDSGAHLALAPNERWFAYMPFEHAEDAQMQETSVQLFTALAEAHPGFEGVLDYAHRHRGVIARFGRFPHRNAILGRASTPEEEAYLAQPGSGF
jgi:uncharacterized protein (DUF924 family)